MILLLLIIGSITYYVVQRSVANLTRTPVWLLWLVMMIPAFFWTFWVLTRGDDPIPFELLLIAFIGSSVLYWVLVQRGRIPPSQAAQSQPNGSLPAQSNPLAELRPTPAPRSLDREEEASLQNCFPWSVFYLQNIEHRPQALICRGQLRTSPEEAYRTVRENVEAQFRDRFLVVFQEGLNGKPFFALVPNPYKQAVFAKGSNRPGVALILLFATLLTTTVAGFLLGQPNPQLPQTVAELLSGLPYAVSLLGILGAHELGHFWAARKYGIRASLPYFIPVPPAPIFPFGTFGAFIQHRSPIPNRKALFDVGFTGPIAGFLVTVPVLLWGLAQSSPVPMTDDSGLLNTASFKFSTSLLLTLLSRLAIGEGMTASSAIDLHPVAIAGYLGLIVTALNLMPVGQLDGGHIVHAMLGQRSGAAIGQVARLLLIGLALVQQEPLFWVWAILLFLMPAVDEPVLNDVSELNNVRDLLGILALLLLLLIILPPPAALLQVLF
ncbi:site-2 protease family protein [Leptolyngbya ohadii]|uniref:site-2 protease family protein n=1 Tax=Leptolyngbya ohadii TaxID=1962290 RepID=UPI000B5A19D5|nr:site-2 protease family protein [Leptolyngbya ohadii]